MTRAPEPFFSPVVCADATPAAAARRGAGSPGRDRAGAPLAGVALGTALPQVPSPAADGPLVPTIPYVVPRFWVVVVPIFLLYAIGLVRAAWREGRQLPEDATRREIVAAWLRALNPLSWWRRG